MLHTDSAYRGVSEVLPRSRFGFPQMHGQERNFKTRKPLSRRMCYGS